MCVYLLYVDIPWPEMGMGVPAVKYTAPFTGSIELLFGKMGHYNFTHLLSLYFEGRQPIPISGPGTLNVQLTIHLQ